jgi:hypothetical protein
MEAGVPFIAASGRGQLKTGRMKRGRRVSSTLLLSLSCFLGSAVDEARSQQPSWQAEWERTVTAARSEGQLVYHAGSTSEAFFREFQKKYPQIKATRMLTQGGSAAD